MQNWLEIEEFSKLVHLNISTIEDMIEKGKLSVKEENGKRFIEAIGASRSLIHQPQNTNLNTISLPGADFIEKTIGTILNLHEKVLDAKDETLEALKSENTFLKEAIFSMQELYDEDRKTIETLSEQLRLSQEEVEFTKRKYKMMWNKVVDNYQQKE
ncbi:MAG: DUF3972 domain-containing protein [Sulfurospirillaceae bacterium]|nr:DUF3972 domain-containing protein [Sulfurospirillaceae bacterium]